MTTWRKGPPPSIGWWPASAFHDPRALRWWDGQGWSLHALPEDHLKNVSRRAALKSWIQAEIEWTDRPASWPERSKT